MSGLAAAEANGPVAIICGGGSFPFTVAEAVERRGRRVVMFPLRGWADAKGVERYPHHWANLGQFGRFVRIARKEGCRDVIFIGSLVRPAIRQLVSFDWETLRLLPRVVRQFYGGDNHLLTGIARIFEDYGFPPARRPRSRARNPGTGRRTGRLPAEGERPLRHRARACRTARDRAF